MRRSRRSRLRRATGSVKTETVPPTPETRAKHRYDVIGRLLANRRIGRDHAAAAEEIRRVVEAAGRGMCPTSMPDAWTGKAPRQRIWRDFIDRMYPEDRHDWERHYLPWTSEMTAEMASKMVRPAAGGLSGRRRLGLVLDIVVDNHALREVEARYRLRHGLAIGYLIQGLEKYSKNMR
jgi:hypothetical protein